MRRARQNLGFIDDLARVASGALGALPELRGQIRAFVKEQVGRALAELDLVTREELEDVQAVAQKARQQQEELEKRLAALEGGKAAQAGTRKKKKKKTTRKKK